MRRPLRRARLARLAHQNGPAAAGTIAITLANRDPRNAGRLVRVAGYVGPIEWDGIEEGYEIETLTGEPFATVKCSVREGPFRLVAGLHRCVCDRRFLRPLVDPGDPLVAGGEELGSDLGEGVVADAVEA